MVTWDLLNENWDSMGAWTFFGSGVSEINPAGQLHQAPNPNNYADRQKDFGSYPSDRKYTVEVMLKMDSWGTGDGFADWEFYDGEHRMLPIIYSNRIANGDTGATISVTTDNNWHVWRFVVDSPNHHMYVYKDGSYIGDLGGGLDYSGGNGTTANYIANPSGASGADGHLDFIRIASGLNYPETLSKTCSQTLSLDRTLRLRHYFLRGWSLNDNLSKISSKNLEENFQFLEIFVNFLINKLSFESLLISLQILFWLIRNPFTENLRLIGNVLNFKVILSESLRLIDRLYPGLIPVLIRLILYLRTKRVLVKKETEA